MSIKIPFSEACERNKDVILAIIKPYLIDVKRVLEIGSGTAQHSIHFSQDLLHLQWQTSDQAQYLAGIEAALNNVAAMNTGLGDQGFGTALTPFELNVNQKIWIESGQRYDAVYTANTLHIMSEAEVVRFFTGLNGVRQVGSLLIIYGPFKYGGKFTSESNANFDASLRSRGVGSAIRDFEWVDELASLQGFELIRDHAMPANNQCIVWQCKA
jgi:hypothetical protein